MTNKSILIFFVLVLSAIPVVSQTNQVASVVHTQYKINSAVLGEERSVLIRVPANYNRGQEKYPVLYMLDAHPPQNSMMAGIIDQQVWGQQIPDMILVGIQNTDRTRDMTPTDDGKGGLKGGGPKFLKFIETEVIPLVEKNYRTQPYRIFAGHSYGGLFAMYAFVTQPDLFNAYIAASPTLDYDNNVIIKRAEELFKQKRDFNFTMFLGVGNEPDNIDGFNSFQDLLKKARPKNLDFEFQQYKNENHPSVVLPVYYAGLRKIFNGWIPATNGTFADLEAHYRKLSDRFGYKMAVPEDLANRAAYQFLRAGNIAQAIEIFKKNVDNYPNSANVYDSLAEAYEKNGDLKIARDNYEKAYKMAEAQGNGQLAAASKASFERVSGKLK